MSKPYAIARIEYVPPSEWRKYDFGKAEYAKAKRRSDRARIESYTHVPMGLSMFAHPQKDAVLEFDTKEKFDAFSDWLDCGGVSYQSASFEYPQKEKK